MLGSAYQHTQDRGNVDCVCIFLIEGAPKMAASGRYMSTLIVDLGSLLKCPASKKNKKIIRTKIKTNKEAFTITNFFAIKKGSVHLPIVYDCTSMRKF